MRGFPLLQIRITIRGFPLLHIRIRQRIPLHYSVIVHAANLLNLRVRDSLFQYDLENDREQLKRSKRNLIR